MQAAQVPNARALASLATTPDIAQSQMIHTIQVLHCGVRTHQQYERAWLDEKARFQKAFDDYYWRQPITIDTPTWQTLPASTAAATNTVTHNHAATFTSKLLRREEEKSKSKNAKEYHGIRPEFSTKTGLF